MKKTYIKANAEVLHFGKADILTLSGFDGKEDLFPIADEAEETEA